MKRLRKFLGWDTDLLIVGGHETHKELYENYCNLSGTELGTPLLAGDLSPVPEYDRLYVIKWSSFHFEIYTPREMEDVILKVLEAKRLGDYT